MQIISEMTGGKIYDEEDNELIGPSYLTEEFIKNSFLKDMKTIFNVIKNTGDTIEFPGPTRSVFIGKKILNENINYEKRIKTTANNIESIFYDVLYRYDNWGIEPSIMAVESNEKDKPIKLKLVSADDNYLVQNYDYIIIGDAGEKKSNDIVLIDQYNLEKNIPKYWFFIDESTILTEKMSENEWYSFRDECRKYNCYFDFKQKAKGN
jgi:signal peptidase I